MPGYETRKLDVRVGAFFTNLITQSYWTDLSAESRQTTYLSA